VLGRAENLDRVEFGRRPDEVDVPVRAGELVIGDARLLHAAHPNGSDRRRTVLTLWYQPDYPSLPERVKAQMVAKTQPLAEAWSAQGKALVSALHPVYDGTAQPHGRMPRPKQPPAATPPPTP
jgi:ectoine hydroxylase-related dioxygenase (phytanoyl-CoA dioxygenase family)